MCASPLRAYMTPCQVFDLRAPYVAPERRPYLELKTHDNSVGTRRSPCYKLSALTLRLVALEIGLTAF